MDAAQLLDHTISLIFGGAGGVVAGIARLSAIIKDLKQSNEELGRKQATLEDRVSRLRANHGELSRKVEALCQTQSSQHTELYKLITAQAETSHNVLNEKIDVMRNDISTLNSTIAVLQRSIGTVEGTLNVLARGSSPMLEDPPTTYRPTSGSSRSPR